jgi:hypothetical protein
MRRHSGENSQALSVFGKFLSITQKNQSQSRSVSQMTGCSKRKLCGASRSSMGRVLKAALACQTVIKAR